MQPALFILRSKKEGTCVMEDNVKIQVYSERKRRGRHGVTGGRAKWRINTSHMYKKKTYNLSLTLL